MKASRTLGRLLISGLCLAAIALGVTAHSYRTKYKDYKARYQAGKKQNSSLYRKGVAKGLEYAKRTIDPVSETPFLIFDTPRVSWEALAPNLSLGYGHEVKRKVLGTFAVPGNYKGSDLREVKWDETNVSFPGPGEYYMRTTVGCFKVLVLDRKSPDDQQILSIATFVSRNGVHSMADARLVQPNFGYYRYHRPDKSLKKLFGSDQPLALHCGYVAEVLGYILRKKGFKVRRIQLQTADTPPKGHLVSQVYFPTRKKWGMIDPDYGAIVTNSKGHPLSIEEIAKAVRSSPEDVVPVDIGNKNWLRPEYNSLPYAPAFAWTTDKMSARACVVPAKYKEIMKRYTHEYWIYDYDEHFQWTNCRKFSWDGSRKSP